MSDLQEVHWFQPNGAPRRLVHGYVSCASITAGAVYAELERRANARALETGSVWSPLPDGIRPPGGQTMMPFRTA